MERYIRLDVKGTWRGIEHRSHFAAYDYTEDERDLEHGVSCYKADADGVKSLYDYARNHMSITTGEGMQLTVFEGQHSGIGSDYEELAWCTKTISETDAEIWFDKMYEAEEKLNGDYYNEELDDYEDEISEEEYEELIMKATGLR